MTRTAPRAVPAPVTGPARTGARLLTAAGLVALVVVAVVAAVVGDLLTPFRVGTVLVPVGVVLVVAAGAVLPRLACGLSGSRTVASLVAPVLLVTALVPALACDGDVLVPGGGWQTLVSYATILGGAVAAGVSAATARPAGSPGPERDGTDAGQDAGADGSRR